MTTTMKLILRPCTVYATTLIHHAKKTTFSCSVSNPRNVSSRPSIQRVSKRQQITATKDNIFRCYSSVGDSTHHHISDAGSIDSTLMLSMQNKIRDQLNAESVVVKDAYGDGRHVSIDVVSSAFEGQSAVNRQRMVYKAIWEELQTTVHAVDQMTTKTPTEAGVQN